MVNGVEYKENHTVIFQPELIIRDSAEKLTAIINFHGAHFDPIGSIQA